MITKAIFLVAAQKSIGQATEVDWQSPRLIIVASGYSKSDTYATNQLNVNLELLRYQHYLDGFFVFETVNEPLSPKAVKKLHPPAEPNPPIETQKPETIFTLESHLARTNQAAQSAFLELRELILALDGVVEKVNQKSQITYRTTKRFAACAFNKTFVQVQFKGGHQIDDPDHRARDITSYQWGYQEVCELRDFKAVPAVSLLVSDAYVWEK